jgi:hypothetical protein
VKALECKVRILFYGVRVDGLADVLFLVDIKLAPSATDNDVQQLHSLVSYFGIARVVDDEKTVGKQFLRHQHVERLITRRGEILGNPKTYFL